MNSRQAFNELDVVQTLLDIPAQGGEEAIAKGCLGTVLALVSKPYPACLVEFADDAGRALATPWIEPQHLRLHWKFLPNQRPHDGQKANEHGA
ncbi:DUF4926 domain-containing protein [Allofranklinella schreckenbergeri]|nr:DUF4926 domain-containing protein [Allofranklinella schreckenbergeri]